MQMYIMIEIIKFPLFYSILMSLVCLQQWLQHIVKLKGKAYALQKKTLSCRTIGLAINLFGGPYHISQDLTVSKSNLIFE